MKQCRKCREIKQLNDFFRSANCKDGLKYWCKNCCAEYKRLRYQGLNGRTKELLPRSSRGGKGFVNHFGCRIIPKKGHPNAWKTGLMQEHVFVVSEHLGRASQKRNQERQSN